jgi:hypothetical protein
LQQRNDDEQNQTPNVPLRAEHDTPMASRGRFRGGEPPPDHGL